MRFFRTLLASISILLAGFMLAGVAEAKRIDIIISKVGQKMTVKIDGRTAHVWPVSTGAAGYETPSGQFRPFRMEAEHFSKEWDDAPMPHSIFFTPRGHAIHGSFYVKSLGRRASHGCVRLAPENAAILFDLVQSAGMSNTSITLKGGFFDFGYAPKRSFASVGDDMDRAISSGNKKRKPGKPWWVRSAEKKPAAAAKKPKKVVATTDKAKAAKVKPKKVQTAATEPAKATPKDAKPAAAKKKVKKVVEKCVAKDGKTPCPKPATPAPAADTAG